MDANSKLTTLFKKYQGYVNTADNTSVGTEYPVLASVYVLQNRVLKQEIPSVAPSTTSGTAPPNVVSKLVGNSPYSYIVKYVQATLIPLLAYNADTAFVYSTDQSENILRNAIPNNYDKAGSYATSVFANIGESLVELAAENFTFDRDAGVISIFGYPSINRTNPPIVTFWRYEGLIGPDGVGADGPTGVTGYTGYTGTTGPSGAQGPQGVTGPTGPTGIQGPQGSTGIQGPQGPTGIQGPQGPTGIQGPQGPTGIQGPQGVTGPTGSQGVQGPTGIQGPQGPTGIQGPQGPTGIQGPQGPTGIQGPQGPTGVQGSQGPTGVQGVQGVQGPTGIQGPQGPTGVQGPQGPTGIQGPQGPTGVQGVQGPTGVQGVQGVTGSTGPQGPQGPTGVQGPQGVTGPTGPQGAQGPTGIQGPQGVQGPTGPQGPQGPTGVTGPQGGGVASYPGSVALTVGTNITITGAAGSYTVRVWPTDSNGNNLTPILTFLGTQIQNGSAGPLVIVDSTNPNKFVYMRFGPANGTVATFSSPGSYYLQLLPVVVYYTSATYPNSPFTTGDKVLLYFSYDGATGPIGSQGVTGPAGTTGPAGPRGYQGATGATGPQGTSVPGATGVTGPQGPTGVGTNGPTGDPGPTGPQGAQGPIGDTGSQGPQGFPGFQGSTSGGQGPRGFQGNPGPADGAQGPMGPPGVQGPAGKGGAAEVGAQGPTGYQGNQGPIGTMAYPPAASSISTGSTFLTTGYSKQINITNLFTNSSSIFNVASNALNIEASGTYHITLQTSVHTNATDIYSKVTMSIYWNGLPVMNGYGFLYNLNYNNIDASDFVNSVVVNTSTAPNTITLFAEATEGADQTYVDYSLNVIKLV